MLNSLVRVSRRVLKVPKAKASPIGVYRVCQNRNFASSRAAPESALGPTAGVPSELAKGLTRTSRGSAPYIDRRASRPGTTGPQGKHFCLLTGSTADLRPTPNGSRRPTRGEVHTYLNAAERGHGRRERRP